MRVFLKYILNAYAPKYLDQGSFDHVKVGNTQFVTPNTHVTRHPGIWNRKQNKIFRKYCFGNMVSDLWKNGQNCMSNYFEKNSL